MKASVILIGSRWSIVNQLGGKISIQSELGKGTDIEVTIPVDKIEEPQSFSSRHSDLLQLSADAEDCITIMKKRAIGKSIFLSRWNNSTPSRQQDISWVCLEKYCTEWFGFQISSSDEGADLVITDQDDNNRNIPRSQCVLIVHEDMASYGRHNHMHSRHAVGIICNPIGPFKLARCLLALMNQIPAPQSEGKKYAANNLDVATQTPLASPQERTMVNGMIMTDYGFTPQTTSTNTPASQVSQAQDTKPENPTTSPRARHLELEGIEQAFASLNPMSSLSLQQPPNPRVLLKHATSKSTSTSSGVFTPNLPTASTATPRPLNILAVDDNSLNLQLLYRYLLKRKSDRIVTARNGLEAVDAVQNLGSKTPAGIEAAATGFDVIFMDISMPEMDGFEATRLIRAFERSVGRQTPFERSPIVEAEKAGDEKEMSSNSGEFGSERKVQVKRERAYVVALTGLASRRDRDEADESGFDDFWTKPISFGKIGELLDRLSR